MALGIIQELSEIFAKIRASLRNKGELIDNFDILIAATAIEYNLILVTSDKDFKRIEGLNLKLIR